jgi:hypothetical protein
MGNVPKTDHAWSVFSRAPTVVDAQCGPNGTLEHSRSSTRIIPPLTIADELLDGPRLPSKGIRLLDIEIAN